MWKSFMIVMALLALSAVRSAHAQWEVRNVNQTSPRSDNFLDKGDIVLRDASGNPFKVFTTDEDSIIDSKCSGSWLHPSNDWRYATDNWLWDNNSYTLKEQRTAANSAIRQTSPSRFKAVDTASGQTKGWFSYTYEGTAAKLEFLCSDPNYRGAGLGLWMINRAVTEAYEKTDRSKSFSMSILSHPAAVSYYNQLDMDCDLEVVNDKSVTNGKSYTYRKSFSRVALVPVTAKNQCYRPYAVTPGAHNDRKIIYGCMSHDEYATFLELNNKLEEAQKEAGEQQQAAIVGGCASYTGNTVTPQEVQNDIADHYNATFPHNPIPHSSQ